MLRYLAILILLIPLLISCERDNLNLNPEISFSADTINFDTIFTTIGSTTRELRVYNDLNSRIVIDLIALSGGSGSCFRLNIDGEPLSEMTNVTMEAGDSLFIFVDVIIDPLSASSPVSVTDSIIFMTGGNTWKVVLQAWGQDIFLLKDQTIGSETWNGGKPYLIYGNLLVDTLGTLTINEGVKIYFHGNASMTVAGKVVVNGTNERRVLFASDRLENMYNDVPGQWKGIHFLNPSKGNSINFATIRGAVNGIQAGEAIDGLEATDLKIYSSEISHCSVSGLSLLYGNAEVVNSIFSHCGKYCIYIAAGGNFKFTHCSVYNFWEYGFRQTAAVFVTEHAPDEGGTTTFISLDFNNSMVYGDLQSEIEIEYSSQPPNGSYNFDHCLIRLDTINHKAVRANFTGTIFNKDPGLIDPRSYDYRPDTLSHLIDMGNPFYALQFPVDYRGVKRNEDAGPDIGAFERVTGEGRENN